MPDDPILSVRDLCAGYGKIAVLHGIGLDLGAAETLAVVGANGAGKTTLLRAIMGQIGADAGTVAFAGRDLCGLPVASRIRLGIGYVPEGRQLFAEMSVLDNLELGHPRAPAAIRRQRIEKMFAIFPKLKVLRKTQCGLLSGGEQQMVAIARALMAAPRLLVLDEPSTGLAPKVVSELYTSLRQLMSTGLTVLVVEQNARAALRFAQRGVVIEDGRVVVQGRAADLLGDPRVVSAYVGAQDACQWAGAPPAGR